jgi:hypothetical protein
MCLFAVQARADGTDGGLLSVPDQCTAGGVGTACSQDADCGGNAYATSCVSHKCQIPCARSTPGTCALGETCVQPSGTGQAYCKATQFRVDLNLVDQAVSLFLSQEQPAIGNANPCSLEGNLDTLLDQNSDGVFDILDVELIIQSFLDEPVCDATQQQCPSADLTFCNVDSDCGAGVYCDPERHYCTRDCGAVASREPAVDVLNRLCSAPLQSCDPTHGRCIPVDVTTLTCSVDSDCPGGAYCLLGTCAPECSTSLDCPDSSWFCSDNSRCHVLPSPQTPAGFVFNPQNYALLFSPNTFKISEISNQVNAPVYVMDLNTKQQVLDNPGVAFGYRVLVQYALMDSAACQQNPATPGLTCVISGPLEFITPLAPFGTVTASGQPTIPFLLNQTATAMLSTGTYSATVTVVFDNGDSSNFSITYNKAGPSGEFTGTFSMYLDQPVNALTGTSGLVLGMHLYVDQNTMIGWNDLLTREHLNTASLLIDNTAGYEITGTIHANETLPFALPTAVQPTDNEIPLKGIYSPTLGTMRVIGVIDLPAGFCAGETGSCVGGDELEVHNPFGRNIQRVVQFFGPYDTAQHIFSGIYREKIVGLLPADVTLDGSFVLPQTSFDNTVVTVTEPIEPTAPSPTGLPSMYVFPSVDNVVLGVEQDADTWCGEALGELNASTAVPTFTPTLPTPAFGGGTTHTDWLQAQNGSLEKFCGDSQSGFQGSSATSAYGDSAICQAALEFTDKSFYQSYLSGTGFADGVSDKLPAFPILPQLVTFDSLLTQGINALSTSAAQGSAALTLYDFLQGSIVLCSDATASPSTVNPSAPAAPGCVDEATLRCGLSLYRKALLEGWAEVGDITGTNGEYTLFCSTSLPTTGCQLSSTQFPGVVSLQEHNRFYTELAQATKFEADSNVSNAAFALYRNALNPFTESTALQYKADQLSTAYNLYEKLIELGVSTPAASIMDNWPMTVFEGEGEPWLKQLEVLDTDRLNMEASLVDLRRRIFASTGQSDQMLGSHLGSQEYLIQVYLAALQMHWQGAGGIAWVYDGTASAAFQKITSMQLQLSNAKNVLGITPDVVFFESSDPSVPNWENYLNILVGQDGQSGLLAQERSEITTAVQNLQASLQSEDSLENSIQTAVTQAGDQMNDLCGVDDPAADNGCATILSQLQTVVSANSASASDQVTAANSLLSSALSSGCSTTLFGLQSVGDNGCNDITSMFTSQAGSYTQTCTLDGMTSTVQLDGQTRSCTGGQMGALLVQQENLVGNMTGTSQTLEQNMEALSTWVKQQNLMIGIADLQAIQTVVFQIIQFALDATDAATATASDVADQIAEGGKCVLVVGLADGTDCPQKIIASALQAATTAASSIEHQLTSALKKDFNNVLTDIMTGETAAVNNQATIVQFNQMVQATTNVVSSWESAYQALEENQIAIYQLKLQTQAVAAQLNASIGTIFNQLTGQESSSVLVTDYLVSQSDQTFSHILDVAYRMVRAFAHRYNLSAAEEQSYVNQVVQAVTVDDVQSLVDTLVQRGASYCSAEGIDCDAYNNLNVLRVSLRDTMFPLLRDIVDPVTGNVVTKGQQFSNLIQSPPYLERVATGVWLEDVIALPFAISLDQPNGNGNPNVAWQIDPTQCGHIIDGDPTGQSGARGDIAVNVIGKNFGNGSQGISYQLSRGDTDQMRDCHAESVQEEIGTVPITEYPIDIRHAGYAPESPQGQETSPPSYATISGSLQACMNQTETQGILSNQASCWDFYARDRTLAAPDWQILIPLDIGGTNTGNGWLKGTGLPAAQRPEIDDIVLYIRYRSRPIAEPGQ